MSSNPACAKVVTPIYQFVHCETRVQFPAWEIFWLVFTFYQTLRPFFGLRRTSANKRPFPPKTRGPKEPLDTEFVHGLSRPLGEIRLEIHDFSVENWL